MKEEKVARPDVLAYAQGRQAERMTKKHITKGLPFTIRGTKQIEKPPVLSDEGLIASEGIVKHHKAKFPWMYKGNDDDWCDEQLHRLITLSETSDVKFLLEAQRDAIEPLIQQAEDALEAARAAILDAIYCEGGLDGHTGSVVMEWITDILGDEKEYRPTIEGVSSQTQISEDKAFLHRDKLIQQAKAEVAREIKEGLEEQLSKSILSIYTNSFLTKSQGWQAFWNKYLKEEHETN